MNILIACTHLPPVAGGAERVVWETATRLSKKHNVHILTTGKRKTEKKNGITIHRIPKKKPLVLFYSVFGRSLIKGIFRGMEFDVLHCHMAGPWGWVLPPLVSHRKLVITCHGGDVYPKTFKNGFFTGRVLKSADAVTCVSKWMKDYVRKEYGKKSSYIPNGMDKRFKPLKMKREKNMILYVGRITENKGIPELLEACGRLPDYEFVFAGRGNLSDKINLHNTKYLGFVPDEEVPVLYNRATMCIFPSHIEGLPVVGLEAMACGCPIIATRCPGFSELIENEKTGIVIKPRSADSITRAIRYLMENEGVRKRLGKNALAESRKYSWEKITGEYERVYRDLLKAPRK